MAQVPTFKIDAKAVTARFSREGIPEQVRTNLRRVLPGLTKRLGANVEVRLSTQLKSRRRLKVDKQLREDSSKIVGVVRVVWTGDAKKAFLPQVLDTGAKAHAIVARNAPALYFFWPKMGRFVSFKAVWHPGFGGIHFMSGALADMETEIVASLTRAVTGAAQGKAA